MENNTTILEEAYKKIIASKELQTKFMQAAKDDKLETFLKDQKIEATVEEVKAYLTKKFSDTSRELSKEELDIAAGGKTDDETGNWVWGSILTGGLYCAITGIIDATKE